MCPCGTPDIIFPKDCECLTVVFQNYIKHLTLCFSVFPLSFSNVSIYQVFSLISSSLVSKQEERLMCPLNLVLLMIGGGGSSRRRRQRRGDDVVHPLKVSLEDLYNGTSKKLSLSRNVICSRCSG